MKKILSISVFAMLALVAQAQEKMPSIYPANHAEMTSELLAPRAPRALNRAAVERYLAQQAEAAAPARVATAVAAETTPGYLPPVGTFFADLDFGGSTTLKAVVGAWSPDMKCWKWRNKRTGYSQISYETLYSNQYPQYASESYGIDEAGNFCDSVTAAGGMEQMKDVDAEGYLWQMATPVQTVTYPDSTVKRFALLQGSTPTANNCAMAVGGLPSIAEDGLWPLTYAVPGAKADFEKDGAYQYGIKASEVGEELCNGFGVQYEQPQGSLCVNTISVALTAKGYNVVMKSKLHYSPLTIRVLDLDGNVLAESSTYTTKTTTSPKFHQQVTFSFDKVSAYGEVLKSGFCVDKAFRVELTGFQQGDEATALFQEDVMNLHADSSYAIYKNAQGAIRREYRTQMQPLIILNGIMNTMVEYYTQGGNEEIGIYGDTIDVAFHSADGLQYNYVCGFANTTYQGQQEFAFYSTFKPYDAETRYWTMDIERPSYILMSADYELVVIEDEVNPQNNVTLWGYYRMFTLYVYATERPVIGDCFSIGKYGKKYVFCIKAVDGETTNPSNIMNGVDETSALRTQKVLRNGKVVIVRGDKHYDILGTIIR